MQIHNFEQHSDDWYRIRLGKLTASHAATIKTAGQGLETLCFDLAAERLTGIAKDNFQTPAMQQGNELEDNARTLFELQTGLAVTQVGFVELDDYIGCSPDGLIGEDAGLEIKCPQDNTFTRYLYDGKIKPEYFCQMQMNMLITNRPRWYYVVYNPHFNPSIVVKEVFTDGEYQEALAQGLAKGKARIQEILTTIGERGAFSKNERTITPNAELPTLKD